MKAVLVLALALLAPPATTAATSLAGRVTRVVDGDSVWLAPSTGGRAIEVRLSGIDAPEICQPHGVASRRFLAALVLRQPVQLQVDAGRDGRDRHGRTLGVLFVGDVEVNRRLVEEGQAWSYGARGGAGPYGAQQRRARALGRGLHEDGVSLERPADFRRRHGPCR